MAASPKNSTAPQMTPPSIAEVTCQTSVLMNRNVTKMSSIGSARVASGNSSPRLAKARLSAHPAMSCIRSAKSAYAAATPATIQAPAANPDELESLARPTAMPGGQAGQQRDEQHQHDPRPGESTADLGAHVVDEVGQPVLEEPGLRAAEGFGV